MVWPERFGYNRTVPLCAKFVQRFFGLGTGYSAHKNIMSIFGALHHMICRLIDAISFLKNINYAFEYALHVALRAIPPSTQVEDFLAEAL